MRDESFTDERCSFWRATRTFPALELRQTSTSLKTFCVTWVQRGEACFKRLTCCVRFQLLCIPWHIARINTNPSQNSTRNNTTNSVMLQDETIVFYQLFLKCLFLGPVDSWSNPVRLFGETQNTLKTLKIVTKGIVPHIWPQQSFNPTTTVLVSTQSLCLV